MGKNHKEVYVDLNVEELEKDIKEAGYGVTEVARMVGKSSSWFAGLRSTKRICKKDLAIISLVLKKPDDYYIMEIKPEPDPPKEAPETNRGGCDETQIMTMLLNIANAVSDLKEITQQILDAMPEHDRAENLKPVPRTDRERLARYLHNSFAGNTAGVKVKDFKQGLKTARICTTGMREIIRDEGYEIVAGGNGDQWIVRKGE